MTAGWMGTLEAHPVWKEARMTSSATRQGPDRTTAEREAWEAYRESLRDLEGADYEEAERLSWARLQGTLRELHAAPSAN
jgi:hypothetical protein